MADFNTNLAKLAADAFGERTEGMSYQQVHNLIEDTITEDPAVQRALDDSTAGTRALMHHILDMNAEDVSARMAATRPHIVPLPPGVPPFDYGEIRQMRDQMLRTSSAIVTGTQQLMIALAHQPDPYDAAELRSEQYDYQAVTAPRLASMSLDQAIKACNAFVGFNIDEDDDYDDDDDYDEDDDYDDDEDEESSDWRFPMLHEAHADQCKDLIAVAIDAAYAGTRGHIISALTGGDPTILFRQRPTRLGRKNADAAHQACRTAIMVWGLREHHRGPSTTLAPCYQCAETFDNTLDRDAHVRTKHQ